MKSAMLDTSSLQRCRSVFSRLHAWKSNFSSSRQQQRRIADSGLFEKAYYLRHNPDVAASGADPLQHYLLFGGSEGRNPGPNFDSEHYLSRYPDVRASGMNPLLHYIEHGKSEGREPYPLFNVETRCPADLRDHYRKYCELIRQAWNNPSVRDPATVDLRAIFGARVPERQECRQIIAEVFLKGSGIEIGALQDPLRVPEWIEVRYVDRQSKSELYEHYPELRGAPLVEVDIIDNGETLSSLSNCSVDFVIANHFLEHTQNPIGTLENLMRVIKPGGTLFLAVPEKSETFDQDRTATTLEHHIRDHREGPGWSRHGHYIEWVTLIEPHFGRRYDKGSEERRVTELEESDYSIHFHCWTPESFRALLNHCLEQERLPASIALFSRSPGEILVLLKKL